MHVPDIKWIPEGSSLLHPDLYAALARRPEYVRDMVTSIEDQVMRSRHALGPRYVWEPERRMRVKGHNALDQCLDLGRDFPMHNHRFVARLAGHMRSTGRTPTTLPFDEELTTLDFAVRVVRGSGRQVLSARHDAKLVEPDQELMDVLPSWRNVYVTLPRMPSPFGPRAFTGCYVDSMSLERMPETCMLTLTCEPGVFDDVDKVDTLPLAVALTRTVKVHYRLSEVGLDGMGQGGNADLPGVREAVRAVLSILSQDAAIAAAERPKRRARPVQARTDLALIADVGHGTGWLDWLSGCAAGLFADEVRKVWSPERPWGGHLANLRNHGRTLVVTWDGPRSASAYSGLALGALREWYDDPVQFAQMDEQGLAVLLGTYEDTPWGPEVDEGPFTTSKVADPRSMRVVVPARIDTHEWPTGMPQPHVGLPASGLSRPSLAMDLDHGVPDASTGMVVALKERWLDARCRSWLHSHHKAADRLVDEIQAEAMQMIDGWREESRWIVDAKLDALLWLRGNGMYAGTLGKDHPLPWRGPWLTPEPSGKVEPTPYGAILFPRVEEAVCAAFFDLCGWRWEYVPTGGGFVVHGEHSVHVTLAYLGDDVEGEGLSSSPAFHETLVVNGLHCLREGGETSLGPMTEVTDSGLTEEEYEAMEPYDVGWGAGWGRSVLIHPCLDGVLDFGEVGLCHSIGGWTDRISGEYGKMRPVAPWVVEQLVAHARLRVAGLDGLGKYETERGPKSKLLARLVRHEAAERERLRAEAERGGSK